jgi:hypothetical protein
MIARRIKENELSKLPELYKHLHDNDDPLPSEQTIDNVWKEINQNHNIQCFGAFYSDSLVSRI